jgi:peroxiredoxin Q/BCP
LRGAAAGGYPGDAGARRAVRPEAPGPAVAGGARRHIRSRKELHAMLEEGTQAPDFTLPDENGTEVSLSQFRGKKVVIYFYPKDDTPGCTKEACNFRDNYDAILEKGAVVLGVSADSQKSHQKFKSKYELPFFLLSDPDKAMIQEYGAWGEKKMYGKTYEGVIRSTYVIDEDGKIAKVFPTVKPAEHGAEVLGVL